MRKLSSILMVQGLVIVVMFGYSNCSPQHTGDELDLASQSACVANLKSGVQPLYRYLNGASSVSADPANPRFLSCKTCHYQGSSSAPASAYFADNDFSRAVNGFANIISSDPNKIYTKVYDDQHYGGSSSTNNAVLDPLRQAYDQAATDYRNCLTQQSVTSGTGPVVSVDDYLPTKQTVAKTVPANQTNPLNLQWDLGSEMQTANSSIQNGVFRITVQAVTSGTGVKELRLTAPSALGSSASAIEIRVIRVYLNGQLVSLDAGGSTWISLYNLAPANNATAGRTTPYVLAQGTGAMNLPVDTASANTIAIGFGDLAESSAYPDFNPTTYARLTAVANNNNANPPLTDAERVFNRRCQSCHNATTANGGLNLAAGGNNLQLIKLMGTVIPFAPNASLIHMRLTSSTAVMPPTGAIPANEIRWVRDWILDGAQ